MIVDNRRGRPATSACPCLPAGPGIRVETGYGQANTVGPYYDPLIAKIIVHAADRPGAIALAQEALQATQIAGVKTNLPFLAKTLAHQPWHDGRLHTGLVADITIWPLQTAGIIIIMLNDLPERTPTPRAALRDNSPFAPQHVPPP